MNEKYINELIKNKRVGTLIKLIKDNEFNWSVNNFQYVFDECINHKLYDVFYFLLEIFNKRRCINFFDNEKYYCSINIKYNINKLFLLECQNGHKEIVEYLLSSEIQERFPNIDPSTGDNCGFIRACVNGHFKIVKCLLSAEIQERFPNINPFTSNNYGFIYACEYGHFKIIEYLLSPEIQERFTNINPSAVYNYGIGYACKNGHKEIVEYLLSPEIQERYPQLNPSKFQSSSIKNVENLIGYSIQ